VHDSVKWGLQLRVVRKRDVIISIWCPTERLDWARRNFHKSSLIDREENHNTQMLHIFAAKPIFPSAGTGFWSLLLHLKNIPIHVDTGE
jgi:hypothetical protein